MGGSKGKPKLPAAQQPVMPAPAPTPVEISQEAQRKAEAQRRKIMSQRGREGTILTGTLGEPSLNKTTLLGDVA